MNINGDINSKLLIVVDDEVDVKPLFEHFFESSVTKKDLDLIFVKSGVECLETLKKNKHKNVLVLSDINMPQMSGVELSKILRAKYPGIIISLLSAGTTIPIKKEYYDYFFSKPVDFDYLVPRVLDILNEA